MVQPLTSLLLALWSGAMNNKRKSGILMHPTSLPGPYGMGEIGVDACAFIDRLADMNQTLWQVLPLGPTDRIAIRSIRRSRAIICSFVFVV